MKLYAVICLLLLSILARAGELDGTWNVVERTCSDGQQPQDRFLPGADKLELKIYGDAVVFTQQALCGIQSGDKCLAQPGGLIRHGLVSENMLVFPDDKVVFRYNRTTQRLIIMTTASGPYSPCRQGETLSTVFSRN